MTYQVCEKLNPQNQVPVLARCQFTRYTIFSPYFLSVWCHRQTPFLTDVLGNIIQYFAVPENYSGCWNARVVFLTPACHTAPNQAASRATKYVQREIKSVAILTVKDTEARSLLLLKKLPAEQ